MEANLDAVLDLLNVRLGHLLREEPPLFRAVVPVRRLLNTSEFSRSGSPEQPAVLPMGVAIDPRRGGHTLKMGGVCALWFGRPQYGLQIFFFI
jgi:hypothetical protein